MKTTRRYRILKCSDGVCKDAEDVIAEEKRLRVSINGEEVLSLYFTPLMVRELVTGLIMNEGIVEGEVCLDRMTVLYGEDVLVDVPAAGKVRGGRGSRTSGCVGGVSYRNEPSRAAFDDDFSIGEEALRSLFGKFHGRSELYDETGCIHSAALSDGVDIIAFAEDIGRHNAVDKVIGLSILEGIGFRGKAMLASGRLSSEIVSKCARWGIPLVASRAAPTALALDIAEESGITLAGFVRGKRLNIYTHARRVVV